MMLLVFVFSEVVCGSSYLADSGKGLSGVVAGGFVALVVGLIVFGILFLVLGLYLIRRGIINDSSVLVVLGILITGFWIGFLYWLIIKDSPSLRRQRDLVYRCKKFKKASEQKEFSSY